ncbi:hypothetical protein [Sulfobacillus sp. hq2]|uniref:hypothetical protein n=1 Tax=Sulfobacillus TaxID=28033 RepID=UPI000CD1F234|nr:hypothetical protein [Sulfobacillus sp. hq2]POB12324.1 hypothetical protein CO251_00205 [Sulfobacillus sp. hq2]
MRLDTWYFQPWAWVWSDLERDRLGRWLVPVMLLTVGIPGWLVAKMPGVLGAFTVTALIIMGERLVTLQRARRDGWDTFFLEPTSWAVRRATERAVWGDPTHWADVPHFERHTQEMQWPSPHAFASQRRAEWDAVYAQAAEPPQWVLVSHTFSTIGSPPEALGYVTVGTPFTVLPRREARALPAIQRKMFGRVVPRHGPSLADPAVWHVVTVPLDGGRLKAPWSSGHQKC